MSALFFLAALVACTFAAQQLQCNFEMRQPSMPNGYVSGVMKYDYVNKKILNTFTTSGTKELFSFNLQGGTGALGIKNQFSYVWSATCGCSISSLPSSIPVYFPDGDLLFPNTADGKTTNTAKVLPTTNVMSTVVLEPTGFPTSSTWANGRVFTYTNCAVVSYPASSSEFIPPTDCKCGKPIDIVLVLDRSSSIDLGEFTLEKLFTQNLVNAFDYSPLGVNLGITNFHTLSWDGPVTLTQGNNPDSVKNGASALQCSPDPQCKVFGSSVPGGVCCGSGTSISSGIVNGADMLFASATTTGFRKDAGKVLIVLTDGYHNKVLKKDATGALARDAAGKPQGVPYQVGTTTCTENQAQTECTNGLLADITWSVQYAITKVPTVTILAVGVGDVWSQQQLEAIANGKPTNVFGTNNWNLLSTLVEGLVSTACQQSPSNPACTACCGFCGCSGCLAPDGCDNKNECETTSIVGTCCSSVPKPPSSCPGTDKCKDYFCDKALNGGLGACTSADKPIKADTKCEDYSCNPTTGLTTFIDLCPPKCLPATGATDCNDDNACTIDTCVLATAGDARSAYCKSTPRVDCTTGKTDKCFTYACDPKTGCTQTLKPVPAETMCAKYTCDPATGALVFTDKCPIIPDCATAAECNDNNACTDDTCVPTDPADPRTNKCVYTEKPTNSCDKADKCFTYQCVPPGGCVETAVPVPATTTCAKYVCNSVTGMTDFTDLCPPLPVCTVDTECNDNNACTDDKCVIVTPGVALSAKCEWTPKAPCNDNDACTYDRCVPATGCVFDPLPSNFCNDNDACTIDVCDKNAVDPAKPCTHTPVVCDPTDVCHSSKCDTILGCTILDIVCPATDNCTVSGCNVTEDGCYVESAGLCGFPVGAVAGIAAGVVAGIVLAAVAGALVVGGGAAYAFTQGAGSGLGATVSNNPIFTPGGERGYNPLSKA